MAAASDVIARPVVGTVEFPGGSGEPCVGARVAATLYSGGDVAYGTADGVIVGVSADLTDNNGAWSLDLEPNDGITPDGTVWQITITLPGQTASTYYIEVPDTAGPHEFTDLLTEQPGALPTRPLVEHAAVTVGVHGLLAPSEYDIRDYLDSDDTSTNHTGAITRALADLPSGGTLHFPPGSWYLTPGVTRVPTGATLTGCGSTVGDLAGTSTLIARTGTGTLLQMSSYTHLRDLCVTGTSTTSADGVAFGTGTPAVTDGARSGLLNVRVANFDNNIVVNYAWVLTFVDVYPVAAKSAGVLVTGNNGNSITWLGGEAVGNTVGVRVDCSVAEHDSINLFGVTIEGNDEYGVHVSGTTGSKYVQSLSIVGCYFEGNWGSDPSNVAATDVYITGALHQGINIQGSRFQTTRTSVNIDGSVKPIIEGNVFRPTTRCVVLGSDCTYPWVGPNVYHSGTPITDGSSTGIRLGVGAAAVSPSVPLHVDGAIRIGQYATGSRPSASTVGAGAMVYDSTLSKPIWSNGSAWKDAAGTTV